MADPIVAERQARAYDLVINGHVSRVAAAKVLGIDRSTVARDIASETNLRASERAQDRAMLTEVQNSRYERHLALIVAKMRKLNDEAASAAAAGDYKREAAANSTFASLAKTYTATLGNVDSILGLKREVGDVEPHHLGPAYDVMLAIVAAMSLEQRAVIFKRGYEAMKQRRAQAALENPTFLQGAHYD